MDVFEHEERLVESGLNAIQAREIVRLVQSSEIQAMTKSDGMKLEATLRREFDAKIDASVHKLIATVWTVCGVYTALAVGFLYAIKFIG